MRRNEELRQHKSAVRLPIKSREEFSALIVDSIGPNLLQNLANRRTSKQLLQVRCDFGELGEGGLEVFDDLRGDDVGIRKIRAVFETILGRKCRGWIYRAPSCQDLLTDPNFPILSAF